MEIQTSFDPEQGSLPAAVDLQPGLELPPFAPFLMQSLRSLGYSLQAALADLVDNSIAAHSRNVSIVFTSCPFLRLVVLDDGSGMSEGELVEAMRFGSTDPRAARVQSDLGRFGLGMKTASLSQCRRFTVVSGRNGHFSAARWDLDESEQRRSWWLGRPTLGDIPQDIRELLEARGHGTAIIWERLDKSAAGSASDVQQVVERAVVDAADHLALVFHRFLSGEMRGPFGVTLNGRPLPRFDPFLEGHARGQTLHTESFLIDGSSVSVSPFVLPFPSRLGEAELGRAGGREGLKNGHGFYIYRGGRLVVPGGWFRIVPSDQLARLARVRVDVPVALDHIWKVDVRKVAAEPPPALRPHLKRIVGEVTERSRRVYTFKGTSRAGSEQVPLWQRQDGRDGGAQWLVNRSHPLVATTLRLRSDPGDAEQLLRLLEDSLPVHDIHLHISNDLPVAGPPPVDPIELEAMLSRMNEAFRDNPDMLRNLRERLPMMEPFSRDPEMARALAVRLAQ